MKRNLDELSATQAEMGRKQTELKSYLSAINNTIASAEFSLTGKLVDANEIFLKVLGYGTADIAGLGSSLLMGDDASVVMMWENLRLGKFFSGEFKMRHKNGRDLWLTGTFNPIFLEGDVPEKIMMFAQFTTQEKEKINDLNALVNVFKSSLPVLEFNPQFACKTANEKAMKIFGLSRMELRSKNIEDFIPADCHALWHQYKEEILRTDVAHFIIPLRAHPLVMDYEVTMSVVRNLEGDIAKVIVLLVREAHDKVSVLRQA